jgi:hypothetical protein
MFDEKYVDYTTAYPQQKNQQNYIVGIYMQMHMNMLTYHVNPRTISLTLKSHKHIIQVVAVDVELVGWLHPDF